ncbi:MBL fold metallo-hydrolase [Glutamicibacter sp. MNS18]|uniref:MBL fold metallo-hydrolase n=1 Tax=Glutamicibacter sp. MNS18 TaxID=2989817 RepID=UPI002235B71D|nr:MBL fold metallo-hydrolase [Glutamicibacter sp. MNS18]MCW4467029.1 MBL fold metallo-hydrolase [Glutamicibacter sp. MNS18]
MRIVTRGHSCVEVSTVDGSILIDPGGWSDLDGAFENQQAVLITHEHADHVLPEVVARAVVADPTLQVYAPRPVVDILHSLLPEVARSRVDPILPGAQVTVGGIQIQTFGGTHATIHHTLPIVANIGYLLGGRIFHPGDSLQVPVGISPEVLLVPAMAPWSKVAEVLDFATAVDAPVWVPIHDGLLNERGLALFDGQLQRVAGLSGRRYRRLEQGRSHDINDLTAKE